MKKLLFALFAAVFAVSIIGCSNSSGGDSPAEEQVPVEEPFVANETPLTLEAITAGTITLKNPWSTLKYKKNGSDFVNVTASANTIAVAAGDKVAFYANGSENTYTCDSSTNMITVKALRISCSSDCYVYGNVMSLLSSSDFKNATSISTEYAFAELFYYSDGSVYTNTHIKNHAQKALVLPATTLAANCYNSMFCGCTGVTSAPVLPATALAAGCYSYMFSGCTSLTSAPVLPATALAASCYSYMFYGCTGLTSAPALPATTLANGCYEGMFYGCTGLTSAPALPATTLAASCYSGMFSGCTSLTSAPALPAMTLAASCYSGMFSGCTSLTSAPALPAMTLANSCYSCMFYGCTSLTSAPVLPATMLADSCYENMFSDCTGLTSAPALPATILADSCYLGMFYGCTSLTSSPELSAETLVEQCYRSMFNGCSSLNSVTCLAISIPAASCTMDWLEDAGNNATPKTFYKSPSATVAFWSGKIPDGWQIENYSAQ